MDLIDKSLAKLDTRERAIFAKILQKISDGKTATLDLKKLKGYPDIFRVCFGSWRVIYRIDVTGKIFLLTLERRSEKTYKF